MDGRVYAADRGRRLDGQPRLARQDDGRFRQLLRRSSGLALVPVRGPAIAWPGNLVLASRGTGLRVGQLLHAGHGAVHAPGRAELSRAEQRRRSPQKEEALEGPARATLAASWLLTRFPCARAWS